MAVAVPVKRRYRWLQFSLRTWLVAFTCLCIWGGWWFQCAVRQKEAVAKLRAGSCVVEYDFQRSPSRWPAISTAFQNSPYRDVFQNVVAVHQGGPLTRATTEIVLAQVPAFPHVETLELWESVTDADLSRIGQIDRLKSLRLRQPSPITDAGVAELRHCPQITLLDLTSRLLTEDGFRTISELPHLKSLKLGPKVSDTDLLHIGKMKQLTSLAIWGEGISDAGLGQLTDLQNLQELTIGRGDQITAAGIEHLSQLPALTKLNFRYYRFFSASHETQKQWTAILPKCRVLFLTSELPP